MNVIEENAFHIEIFSVIPHLINKVWLPKYHVWMATGTSGRHIEFSPYLRAHPRVPADVVPRPEFDPPHAGHGQQDVLVEIRRVQRVQIIFRI